MFENLRQLRYIPKCDCELIEFLIFASYICNYTSISTTDISFKAVINVSNTIQSIQFVITDSGNSQIIYADNIQPYYANGDDGNGIITRVMPGLSPDTYTIMVTGYSGPNATGTAGQPLIMTFTTVNW